MTTIINPGPTIPEWPHQRPSGKLYLGTMQYNLVDGVLTLVELDTIPDGFADGIEDTTLHRITPGHAGFYHLTGQVALATPVADRAYNATIRISGATYACFNYQWYMGETSFSLPLATLVKLTATDYLELMVRSRAGVDTINISKDVHNTFLSVQRVR